MSVFLSCGEASGDNLISSFALSLRDEGYQGPLWGMGGPSSQAAGVECLWPSSELHIMGITQALKALPRLNGLADRICDEIMRRKPSKVVVADSPDFHIPLVRRLRRRGYGGKTIFLSPPTVWAWRKGRVVPLRELFDLCLPLFGFEDRYLRSYGVTSSWIGHPMVDSFGPPSSPPGDGVIALLLGSRKSEVKHLLPVLLNLARKLKRAGLRPVFSVAPSFHGAFRYDLLKKLEGQGIFTGNAANLIERSDLVVGASGTVAVEAMMSRRFMVVLYRSGALEWFVYSNFVKLPYISIPNVMTGRSLFPERLQDECNPFAIWGDIRSFMASKYRREQVYRGLDLARSKMGSPGAKVFWAKSVIEL
nr:lipid-A-disaccharide synthase [uncultured Dethiosulfovibrio sp.]